jgi:hypothetical protein
MMLQATEWRFVFIFPPEGTIDVGEFWEFSGERLIPVFVMNNGIS